MVDITSTFKKSEKTASSHLLSSPSPLKSIKKTFLISFNKFHMTCPNRAGSNKIYGTQRSKSYFFELVDQNRGTNDIHLKIHTNDYRMDSTPISYDSTSNFPNRKFQISTMLTHFFQHQHVIPRRFQNKFFKIIRSKLLDRIEFLKSRGNQDRHRNTSTKSFFNFTYRRYRFHFGVYIPCNHLTNQNLHQSHSMVCKIPTPFIMSNNRTACIIHHKDLDIYQSVNNTPKLQEKSVPPVSPVRPKIFHEQLLRDKVLGRQVKNVFSNRLGLSYNILFKSSHLDRFHMYPYRKRLEHMEFAHSRHVSTKRKQLDRFERRCRRIFSYDNQNIATSAEDQCYRARQHRFLIKSQLTINIPIRHCKDKTLLKKAHIPLVPIQDMLQDWSLPKSGNSSRKLEKKKKDKPNWRDGFDRLHSSHVTCLMRRQNLFDDQMKHWLKYYGQNNDHNCSPSSIVHRERLYFDINRIDAYQHRDTRIYYYDFQLEKEIPMPLRPKKRRCRPDDTSDFHHYSGHLSARMKLYDPKSPTPVDSGLGILDLFSRHN